MVADVLTWLEATTVFVILDTPTMVQWVVNTVEVSSAYFADIHNTVLTEFWLLTAEPQQVMSATPNWVC